MNKLWIGNGTSQNAPERKRKKTSTNKPPICQVPWDNFWGCITWIFPTVFKHCRLVRPSANQDLRLLGLVASIDPDRDGVKDDGRPGGWETGGGWVVLEKMPGVMEMSCSCLQFCKGIIHLFLVCLEDKCFVLLLCSCTFLTLSRWSFLGGWYYIDHCKW